MVITRHGETKKVWIFFSRLNYFMLIKSKFPTGLKYATKTAEEHDDVFFA